MLYLSVLEGMVLQNTLMILMHDIIESADEELFCRMQREEHCLHNILPPIRHGFCELRNRGHNFVLPLCKYDIYKKSFLPRSLYKFLS
jgi:hypothetical protein